MTSPFSRAILSRLFTSTCAILASFVSLKLYNLYLTKEIYGVILVGVQIIAYLPLAGAGFMTVLNQRTLTDRDAASAKATAWFAQLLQNYLILIVLVVAVVLMSAYSQTFIARSSGLPFSFFLTVGLAAVVTFYMSDQIAFLIGQGEQVKCYFFQGIMNLLNALVLYLAFASGLGVWAFPISGSLSALLLFLPVREVLRRHMTGLPLFVLQPTPDFNARFKVLWRPALDCLKIQGWNLLMFTLDIILVGLLVGPGPAAVYGIISRVAGMSRHVLHAVGEVSFPRLAQETDPGRKALFMRKVDHLNAWNVGCWFGAMGATLLPFLGWLLKADWVAGSVLIALMLTRHAIISLTSPQVFGIVSLGLFKENARLVRLDVIASTIPAIILSYPLGNKGVALGYLVGTCWVSGWQFTRFYFRSSQQDWFKEWCAVYARALAGALLAYLLTATLWRSGQAMWAAPGWTAILVGGIGFGVAWAATAGTEMLRTRPQPSRA